MSQSTYNPFRNKATRARAVADRYNRPTAHDAAMAQAFPLGAGYGRKGADKRIEATITRAGKAIEAARRAAYLEAQADAFDAGTINAQGRRMSAAAWERSDKRADYQERKAARIAAARAACEGKRKHEIPAETWADAWGYLGGPARAMIIAEHPTCENVCTCAEVPTFDA